MISLLILSYLSMYIICFSDHKKFIYCIYSRVLANFLNLMQSTVLRIALCIHLANKLTCLITIYHEYTYHDYHITVIMICKLIYDL